MRDNGRRTVVYIGIGSNLGDRIVHLRGAIRAVKQLGDLISVSSVYETEPFGVEDEKQPMYLNMVVQVRTRLEPRRLLKELLRIEIENSRVRNRRNESRTLDLDVLLYGDELIQHHDLSVPHPRMHERAFVMIPLAEIAPRLMIPAIGRTASEIALALPDQGVRRIGQIEGLPVEPMLRNLA